LLTIVTTLCANSVSNTVLFLKTESKTWSAHCEPIANAWNSNARYCIACRRLQVSKTRVKLHMQENCSHHYLLNLVHVHTIYGETETTRSLSSH